MKISLKSLIKEMESSKPRFRAQLRPDSAIERPEKKINRGAGGTSYTPSRSNRVNRSNSVWDIVDFLKKNPGATESEINKGAFGYDRNSSRDSNKKYADLLRRAVQKGIVQRAQKTGGSGVDGIRKGGYVYFVPGDSAKGNSAPEGI